MTRLEPLLTPDQTRYLLAVLFLLERDGRATVRGVCKMAGRTENAVHTHLVRLRRLGLVTWEDGRYGTLRSPYRLEMFEGQRP